MQGNTALPQVQQNWGNLTGGTGSQYGASTGAGGYLVPNAAGFATAMPAPFSPALVNSGGFASGGAGYRHAASITAPQYKNSVGSSTVYPPFSANPAYARGGAPGVMPGGSGAGASANYGQFQQAASGAPYGGNVMGQPSGDSTYTRSGW
ncbi:hypothetical protein HK405_011307 [Cladochytrium tenue]|nr:hypothetical protein HK405_011307 [Cladochytrium tenue]